MCTSKLHCPVFSELILIDSLIVKDDNEGAHSEFTK